MDIEQQQADTEDVFDTPPDAAADAQAAELQTQERQQQRQPQRQTQQPPAQPQSDGQQQGPELTEGMRLDEHNRRYIIESGKRVYFDPKPGQGDESAPGDQTQSTSHSSTQQQTTQQPPAPAFDAGALEQVVRAVVGGMQPQGQQQQQVMQKLTPEQEDQLMNRWRPSKDWYAKFQNPDTLGDAIGEMRDGLIKEAATAAKYLMDMYVGELKPVIAPLTEHVNQQRVTQWRNDFFSKYKSLEPYESLLDMVVKAKTADGKWKPKDRDSGFQEIAADVERVIKTQNPQFSLATAPTTQQNGQNGQKQQTTTTTNRMSRTTSGGGGGSGGASKAVKFPDQKLDGGIWE